METYGSMKVVTNLVSRVGLKLLSQFRDDRVAGIQFEGFLADHEGGHRVIT
jgi:hypothetical protein